MNPRKSNVSGRPSPLARRSLCAFFPNSSRRVLSGRSSSPHRAKRSFSSFGEPPGVVAALKPRHVVIRIALRSYFLAPCAAAIAARPVRPAHGEDTCSPISAIPQTPAGFPVRCPPAALLTSLRREATSSVRRANRRSPVRCSTNRNICSRSVESKNPLMSARPLLIRKTARPPPWKGDAPWIPRPNTPPSNRSVPIAPRPPRRNGPDALRARNHPPSRVTCLAWLDRNVTNSDILLSPVILMSIEIDPEVRQTRVEKAFRCIKTVDLNIRPIYHGLEARVRAHVFICVLACYCGVAHAQGVGSFDVLRRRSSTCRESSQLGGMTCREVRKRRTRGGHE